jgi:hypothetical protein
MAIHTACWLIENGYEVYGIRSGSYVDLLTKDEIEQIYSEWEQSLRPETPRRGESANSNEAPVTSNTSG